MGNIEPEGSLSAIIMLRNNFATKGEKYVDMLMTMQEYLEQSIGVDERDSMTLLMEWEVQGVLPTEELYDIDPEAAVEKSRLAVYTSFMPMYQLTHTSDEFEEWLPYGLEIVVPTNGRHTTELCINKNSSSKCRDETCYMSLQCPMKYVEQDVLHNLTQCEMDTIDYLIDHEKACRNAQLLISAVAKRGIITNVQQAAIEHVYMKRYMAEFPKADPSQ